MKYIIILNLKLIMFYIRHYFFYLRTVRILFRDISIYHHVPLVRWSLYKYKCLWSVGGKGWGSSPEEGVSHTYTLRLG